MAGKFGSAMLAAGSDTLLFQNSTGNTITLNVRFCNQSSSTDDRVRLAIGPAAGSGPASADYVTYDTVVKANGMLEDTGIRVDPTEKVWVRSANGTTSVRGHGA